MRILDSINHIQNEFMKQMNYEFRLNVSAPMTRKRFWFDALVAAGGVLNRAKYDRRGMYYSTDADVRAEALAWLRWKETDE